MYTFSYNYLEGNAFNTFLKRKGKGEETFFKTGSKQMNREILTIFKGNKIFYKSLEKRRLSPK